VNVIQTEEGILLQDIEHFHPGHIFECGQAFRWNWDGTGYTGVVQNKVLRIFQRGRHVLLQDASLEDYHILWKHYFDLDKDYGLIKKSLSRDRILAKAMEYGWGIRILNQDPFETLISFIISSNNGIKRIKGIIENLSKRFGEKISWKGREVFRFPKAESLAAASIEDLLSCGCGYRAPYVKKTASMVADGKLDLDRLKKCQYEEAFELLLTCSGVGPKVADCVLLFSLEKGEAFPIDVWIKRIMVALYFGREVSAKELKAFAAERFGPLAGIAQQYLFYYARERKIGQKKQRDG